MTASARPDSMELADYLGVLRRRWWIVALLVVVGAGAGAAYAKVAPKTYSASVLIEVTALPNNANSVSGRTGGNVNMDNEAQVATSTEVAAIAARTLHDGVTALALSKDVTVAVPPNTTFLQLKCGMPTPGQAMACANAVGRAYLTQRRNTAASGISGEVNAQNGRITELTSRVTVLKAKVAGFKGRGKTTARVRIQLSLNQAQTQLAAAESDNAKLVPFLDDLNAPGNTMVGQVATPASLPTSPSSPRTLLVLPSGLVGGLLLGLLGAFVLDFRDRRIHSARDVERFLDLPVLVDLAAGNSRMQPAVASPRSRTGQSFTELGQYVATSLGEGSHVVFVAGTSAGPGCSVLAANLAATLARTRSRVLLVCADPGGTVTPQLTGVADDRGLADVLAGTATVAEAAQQASEEPQLAVLTPGQDVSGALLNLQYEASRRLLSELRRDYRYVIVEVQSVGEDASAFALAEFADAAVMAVETTLTTRPGAADCLQRLDRLRTSVLGAVVLPAQAGQPARPLPEVGSVRRPPAPRARPEARPESRPEPRPEPRFEPRAEARPDPSSGERRRPSAPSAPPANGRTTSSSPWPPSALPRSEPQPSSPSSPGSRFPGPPSPAAAPPAAEPAPPLSPPPAPDPLSDPIGGSRSSGSRGSGSGSRSRSTRSGSHPSDPGSRSAPVGSSARASRGDDLIPWPEPPDQTSEE
ncbi:MAG TPA: Wzz/FepE/Etk N-terminal domain-containing protein [Streptosporangiaceae bacterium]|nr:Wzz/FepE/Etk N-terminal domain-containing protein [Streptosporangiaceae bacterium]